MRMLIVLLLSSLMVVAQDETTTFTLDALQFDHPATWNVYEFEPELREALYGVEIIDSELPQLFYGTGMVFNLSNVSGSAFARPTLNDSLSSVLDYFTYEDITPYGDMQRVTVGDNEIGYVCPCGLGIDSGYLLIYHIAVSLGNGNYFYFEATVPDWDNEDRFEALFLEAMGSMTLTLPALFESIFPAPVAGDAPVRWQITESPEPLYAVTVSADGMLLVTSGHRNESLGIYTGSVVEFDADGTAQRVIATPDLPLRGDVVATPEGGMWVADFYDCQLLHLEREGQITRSIDTGQGFSGCRPQQLEIDSTGNLITLNTPSDGESAAYGIVQIYTPDGERLREFDLNESGDFAFDFDLGYTAGFTIDSEDRLYVVNSAPVYHHSYEGEEISPRVRVFDLEGTLINDDFASDIIPGSVYAAPDDTVFVLSEDGVVVHRYDSDGTLLSQFELPVQIRRLNAIQPLALLPDGDLVILDGLGTMLRLACC